MFWPDGSTKLVWIEQTKMHWFLQIGAIVAKQDGGKRRRIGQAWMLVFAK
jgi:hypothetical protein